MQLLDLPRDPNGSLVGVRSALVKATNSARHSASKREVLKVTLEAILEELNTYAPVVPVEPLEDTTEAPVAIPAKAAPKTKRATAKVKKDEITS